MMKRLPAALLAILLFTGCLKQDWSLCVAQNNDSNLTLSFRYELSGDVNEFSDYISSVDVFLYDAFFRQVEHRRLERADLEILQGTTFEVTPGVYYAVCWGNVDDHSQLDEVQVEELLTDRLLHTTSPESGSPLYYSPYMSITEMSGMSRSDTPDYSAHEIAVPQGETVTREMEFIRAHRTLNIYVQNYEDPVEGINPRLKVTVTNLAEEYDYLMRVRPSRRDYTMATQKVTTPDGEMVMVKINTPYYEIKDNIDIHLEKYSDGTPICQPVNLLEYIEDNPTTIAAINNATRGVDVNRAPHELDILIKFLTDGSVSIVMPDWGETPVGPVW